MPRIAARERFALGNRNGCRDPGSARSAGSPGSARPIHDMAGSGGSARDPGSGGSARDPGSGGSARDAGPVPLGRHELLADPAARHEWPAGPDALHCRPAGPAVVRTRRLALDGLTAVLAVTGIVLVALGGRPAAVPTSSSATSLIAEQGPPGPLSAAVDAGSPGKPPPPVMTAAGPAALPRSVPTQLAIPAIGISTSLMPLGLNGDGTIAVPPLRPGAPAGWYQNLATPGEVGPAIILGHVDTRDGPAIFYRLRELRPGAAIAVTRADGRTAVFTVNQVSEYPKSAFPAGAVYGAVDRPVLRLITCGGTFDRLRHSYRGNVVVFASLTGIT